MAKTAGTIEDHFKAIDAAVAALEDGDLPLEQALARYETGLKALRAAKGLLDAYQARLDALRTEDAPGPDVVLPADEPPTRPRARRGAADPIDDEEQPF